jgi:galactitol-specific phosphotransferase system IIB component
MYTEDVLKEMGIDAKVEASDATQAKGARADLILTSPPLVEHCSGGTAVVKVIKSFVNKAEIRSALLEFISERGK